MSKYRVLLTGNHFRRTDAAHEKRLIDAGCEIVMSPYGRPATEAELIPLLEGVDAVLASTDHFTKAVFAASPRLKIVARWGVGYDAIDVDGATEHGVWITTTPGTNEHSVADATLTMILAIARDVVEHVETTRAGKWDRLIGVEMLGQTIGVIGFGRIGRQVAIRSRAFGMRVLAYDPVLSEQAIRDGGADPAELEEVLRQADWVTLHAPSMPETHDLINARTLAMCKKSAFIINTARGDLVNEDDLAEALRAGTIAGAALDVFKTEPITLDNPLRSLPNVLPFPHIAGITKQSSERMSAMCVDNILTVLAGRPASTPVNHPATPRH